MNSYGDPSSARGRAEADRPAYGRGYSDATPHRATGSVPLGRAAAPVARASAAVAAPGRTPVGPATGRATVGAYLFAVGLRGNPVTGSRLFVEGVVLGRQLNVSFGASDALEPTLWAALQAAFDRHLDRAESA